MAGRVYIRGHWKFKSAARISARAATRLSRLSRAVCAVKGFCATGQRQREDTKTSLRRAALIETRSRTHCVEIAARADAVCFVKRKKS